MDGRKLPPTHKNTLLSLSQTTMLGDSIYLYNMNVEQFLEV